ncbi:hypothetical protein BKA67DRAFT_559107 [Truncatella angustata]|uniref:Uncharacterized protein n=1 Tax=Truncatella angustata TaxID=152316 RepID=A0A9P8UMS6_9PEZI|nr:uncharacterized protein BKA67DRAFT_559107 [Truncatella angustata]KAH6654972.1 hypothetical protein BKA67DRAFT_559107 [Truncatella angustata]
MLTNRTILPYVYSLRKLPVRYRKPRRLKLRSRASIFYPKYKRTVIVIEFFVAKYGTHILKNEGHVLRLYAM